VILAVVVEALVGSVVMAHRLVAGQAAQVAQGFHHQ
jgi:hypothetical protein